MFLIVSSNFLHCLWFFNLRNWIRFFLSRSLDNTIGLFAQYVRIETWWAAVFVWNDLQEGRLAWSVPNLGHVSHDTAVYVAKCPIRGDRDGQRFSTQKPGKLGTGFAALSNTIETQNVAFFHGRGFCRTQAFQGIVITPLDYLWWVRLNCEQKKQYF